MRRVPNRIDGVTAEVNIATGHAHLITAGEPQLDQLIAAVTKAGNTARPVTTGASPGSGSVPGSLDAAPADRLWRRLALAVVLGAPLGDLSHLTLAVHAWS